MHTSSSLRWLAVAVFAAMLLAVAAACSAETIEVPGETVVVEKEVVKEVMVPGETVTVEVVKEVQVPGETVVVEKVVTETVEVPGETVVVEKEVVKTVEVPGQTVTVEVVKEVMVPGETVVVEQEVVKTVEVPGQTVVVEKVVVQEVAGKKYVTDPVIGNVIPAPEYGGTLVFAGRNPFDKRLDPYIGGPGMSSITSGVMEKLGMVDWAIDRSTYSFGGYPPPVSAMTGSLAESWDASHTGATHTFNIRQGVNWHDKAPINGREMDAYDVEFSFHRMLGNKLSGTEFSDADPSPGAGSLGALPWKSVKATDKWTVVFELEEPRFFGPRFILDWYSMFIYAPEMVETYGEDWNWDKTVGTGPYTISDLTPGTGITYAKNPNYYRHDEKFPDNQLPYIDVVKGLWIPVRDTWIAGVRTAQIDYIGWQGVTNLNSADERESLQRTNPELVFGAWSERSEASRLLNVFQPPFDDISVRRAMQMALDLETINSAYYKYAADIVPRGRIHPDAKGYHTPFEQWSDEIKGYYTYDPEGAKKLLDEAGYTVKDDGTRFSVDYLLGSASDQTLPQIQAEYWRAIGADVNVLLLEGADIAARRNSGDWGIHGWIAGVKGDPVWQTSYMYSRKPNPAWIANDATYDAFYEQILVAQSEEERQRLVTAADDYLIEQHWVIWGGDESKYSVWQPWMVGYNLERGFGAGQNYVVFSRLWIDSALKSASGR